MSFFKVGRCREKVFGMGRPLSLDRNAKARIMTRARVLMRRTRAGKAYGRITAKDYAVLGALLYAFHNSARGWCYPGYKAIADAARCALSTVANALKRLETAGLLSWVNRMKRIREWKTGPMGFPVPEVRVVRTSNAYHFHDPQNGIPQPLDNTSESENQSGTTNQDSFYSNYKRQNRPISPPRGTTRERSTDFSDFKIELKPITRIGPTLARMLGIEPIG